MSDIVNLILQSVFSHEGRNYQTVPVKNLCLIGSTLLSDENWNTSWSVQHYFGMKIEIPARRTARVIW